MKVESNMTNIITVSTDEIITGSILLNDTSSIYCIPDDYKITSTIRNRYDEPKYKLRKCECCGGPIKGLTCGWCGAEYEVYY